MENLVPFEKITIMPTQEVVEVFLKNQTSPGTSKTYGNTLRYFLHGRKSHIRK